MVNFFLILYTIIFFLNVNVNNNVNKLYIFLEIESCFYIIKNVIFQIKLKTNCNFYETKLRNDKNNVIKGPLYSQCFC